MRIQILTDIATEPVTLTELKAALRVTGNGHDATLTSMITAARKYMEKAIQKSLGERTIKVTSEDELEDYELPYGPNQTITDEDTDDDDNYIYTYTTGFDEVPEDIKQGIMYLVKHWYDIDDVAAPVPASVEKIISLNVETPML